MSGYSSDSNCKSKVKEKVSVLPHMISVSFCYVEYLSLFKSEIGAVMCE